MMAHIKLQETSSAHTLRSHTRGENGEKIDIAWRDVSRAIEFRLLRAGLCAKGFQMSLEGVLYGRCFSWVIKVRDTSCATYCGTIIYDAVLEFALKLGEHSMTYRLHSTKGFLPDIVEQLCADKEKQLTPNDSGGLSSGRWERRESSNLIWSNYLGSN